MRGRNGNNVLNSSLASGLSLKDNGIQAVTLPHVVRMDVLEVNNAFSWEDTGDKNKVMKILEKFEAYCVPWRNITWERHVFNTQNQHPSSMSQTSKAKPKHVSLKIL